MEGMHYIVTDEFGHYIHDLFIPWTELWTVKRVLLCDVQYGQIIWH